jgi:uroporphyrinogen decarboxylase
MNFLKNDRLLRALLRQPVDRTPIWIMRQAGRYLPEYRAVRAKAGDFLTLCKTPELACEVTLQPLKRFALDAAIVFSDILTIPDAMGLGLYFTEGEGPKFKKPLQNARDIEALCVPDPEQQLRYVMETIRLCRHELQGSVPLIGFSGSPWTLAAYMIEGGSSREFHTIKKWLYQEPETLHQLLEKLSNAVALYLNAQIAAGAQAVMIFDTWGGVLSTPAYKAFSLHYMANIVKQLQRCHDQQTVPVILFTKGAGQWLEAIADTGCDAIGLDWTIDIGSARQRVGSRVALQGNLDPAILLSSLERIAAEAKAILAAYGKGPGHVFNLGHGISQNVPPEHVHALVEAIQTTSPLYHI